MVDQRIFERFSVSLPLRLLDLDGSQETEATTCDLSAKGVGIISEDCLKFGDAVELWIIMPDKKDPFYTRGRLVWTAPDGADRYRSGISLEKAEFMGVSRMFRVEK